ncbi:MAG: hypothetical protein OXE85_11465 [Roseovarius sp.]|nr:hypothetical protein [Roseovarius sp.]
MTWKAAAFDAQSNCRASPIANRGTCLKGNWRHVIDFPDDGNLKKIRLEFSKGGD